MTLATTLNEILTGIKTEAKVAQNEGQPASPLSKAPVTITADKPTNSLIINASPDDYRTIEEIIAKLDIKRKQVYVEALVLELSMDATQRLGASISGAVNIGNDSVILGSSNLNTGSGHFWRFCVNRRQRHTQPADHGGRRLAGRRLFQPDHGDRSRRH